MTPAPLLPPRFSVIIPVYRQWPLFAGLYAALQAQTLPIAAYEIIIVNNGPAGEVPAFDLAPDLAPALRWLPPALRLLHCATPGSYAARNLGAAAARGDWLVFTDADCLPAPDWLQTLATAILATATGATAGGTAMGAQPQPLLAGPVQMIVPGRTPPVRPNAYETYDLLRGIPQARYVRQGYAATANLTVPRAVFAALGGFDPARLSGGDAAFCRKAGLAGHPVRFVPGAVVGHPCRSDWAALAIKARRVKGGQLQGGTRASRWLWLARSLTPPLRQILRLARTRAPLGQRLTASAIALRLWGVELAEILRLLAGGAAERR